MTEVTPKQEVSALQTLLDTINYQRQTIDNLTARISVLESGNTNIDYYHIRNIPNFVYNITKENDTLKILYFYWNTDLIPLNNKDE